MHVLRHPQAEIAPQRVGFVLLYEDAIDYGRDLIPLVRSEVARRESAAVAEPVAAS